MVLSVMGIEDGGLRMGRAAAILMFAVVLATPCAAQEKISLSDRRVVEDTELRSAVGRGENGVL